MFFIKQISRAIIDNTTKKKENIHQKIHKNIIKQKLLCFYVIFSVYIFLVFRSMKQQKSFVEHIHLVTEVVENGVTWGN